MVLWRWLILWCYEADGDIISALELKWQSIKYRMNNQVSDVADASIADDGNDSDGDGDLQSSKSKTVHSMVEKKRRDKMAQYVTELSTMIPMCGVMQRKLDKITVLRMAVQHLKAVKGSKVGPSDDALHSTPIGNEGIMKTILESAKCFLFVVACDRGKFLYVSESVNNFIVCVPFELIGQSIFDVLHSKDIAKVKEQLIASDVTAREVFIDAKTMEPVNPEVVPKEELSVASSGAARSFFCRMKNRLQPEITLKTEPEVIHDQMKKRRPVHTYINLHCTGFVKTWASSKVTSEAGITDQSEASCNLACLVAIARLAPRLTSHHLDSVEPWGMKPIQFFARLACDYKFTFVEPLVTYVTGFLPQEIIGGVVFELFMDEDRSQIREFISMATKTKEKLVSPVLTIRTVDNSPMLVRVVFSSFINPFTTELEHILLDITAVSASYSELASSALASSAPSLMTRAWYDDVASAENISQTTHTGSVHSEPPFSGSEPDDEMNDEASQAMLMNLLEADGGLGGVVPDQNLSWISLAKR